MKRVLLYLYSGRNLVGTLLALLGLAAYLLGFLGAWWLPIVLGLYALGALVTPARGAPKLQLQAELDEGELRAELNRFVRSLRGRLPPDAMERVSRIQANLQEALPRLAELGSAGDQNAYLVRQTITDYLPATLRNYLRLPRAYANMHPVQDGRTAHQVLVEQLDVLDRTVSAVVSDLARGDTEQLLANGRFLQEKFRTPDFQL